MLRRAVESWLTSSENVCGHIRKDCETSSITNWWADLSVCRVEKSRRAKGYNWRGRNKCMKGICTVHGTKSHCGGQIKNAASDTHFYAAWIVCQAHLQENGENHRRLYHNDLQSLQQNNISTMLSSLWWWEAQGIVKKLDEVDNEILRIISDFYIKNTMKQSWNVLCMELK